MNIVLRFIIVLDFHRGERPQNLEHARFIDSKSDRIRGCNVLHRNVDFLAL